MEDNTRHFSHSISTKAICGIQPARHRVQDIMKVNCRGCLKILQRQVNSQLCFLPEINVGHFILREQQDHKGDPAIWIESPGGEGMSVSSEVMLKLISDFYNENF